ncbi:MAG: hypothetical protein WCT04_24150 [Planctomycetota bacterium]
MPAHPTSDKPKSLPRLRFSLRTLLLCVLSLASLATLWWNWGPWQVAFVVTEPQKIGYVQPSIDDRFMLIACGDYDPDHSPAEVVRLRRMDVRRLPGGEQHTEFDFKFGGRVQSIGRYFVIEERDSSTETSNTKMKVIDAETLQSLEHDELLKEQHGRSICHVLPNYIYRKIDSRKSIEIYKLPNFTPVMTIDAITDMPHQDPGRDLVCYYRNGGLEILNLETGKTIVTEKVDKEIYGVDVSPTTMTGCAAHNNGLSTVYVFSLANGKLLMKKDLPEKFVYWSRQGGDGSRYVTQSTEGIELHDVFSGKILATSKITAPPDSYLGYFSLDASLWYDELSNHIRDGLTLKALWKTPDDRAFFSGNSGYVALNNPMRICMARTGDVLMDFSSLRWRTNAPPNLLLRYDNAGFSRHSGDFWKLRGIDNQLTYFHMTRPPTWLSILSKPELWLSLVLCSSFIWSIWRGIK